jgi:hypothetical protein
MKIRFLALGLMATIASVASAHVLMPLPEERTRAAPPAQTPPQSTASLPGIPAPPIRNASSSDATRAPVPVRLSHRPEFVPSSPLDVDPELPGKMTETAAKAAMEADGYKGIRALARGPDGVWKASALRGQTEVRLSVGPTGSVSAN